jgi:hypothetical protein
MWWHIFEHATQDKRHVVLRLESCNRIVTFFFCFCFFTLQKKQLMPEVTAQYIFLLNRKCHGFISYFECLECVSNIGILNKVLWK